MLERYSQLREAVRVTLQSFYDEELAERDYTSSFYRKMHEQIADFAIAGGKKFRPVLFLLTIEAYGASPEAYQDVAGALELLHAFRIIHDDIVDHDALRRGKPALHVQLARLLPGRRRMSSEAGILAGDLVLLHAWKLLARSNLPDDLLRKAWARMLEAMIHTTIGQLYDIHDTFKPLSKVKHEHILFTHTYKTAKYSFDLPLTLAALLTGHEQDIPLLEEAATLIGIAYQLQDDYLSLYGDAERLGKPVESDLQHAKKTLIMKWTYDAARDEEKERLRKLIGKKPSAEDFAWLRELVDVTGVKKRIEAYINDLYKEGIDMLAQTGMRSPQREAVEGFLSLIRQRTY